MDSVLRLLAAISMASVVMLELPQQFADEAGHPNILFIAVDDLRPSLGCYGDEHAVSPNIDRLASRGMRFDNAHCQVAVCNPSRASLMTGLRPDKLGVWTLPIHFREAKPDAVTLPQWLRRSGYTAVSHGKIFHNPTPDPQSWSEPIRQSPRIQTPYPAGTPQRIKAVQQELPASDWRKNNLRGPSTAAPDVEDNRLIDGARTNMAIQDLKRLAAEDAPFFLAMGYIRPHLAWIAPKKYWDLHDPQLLPVITDQNVTPNTPPYALSNSYELTHYVDLVDFPGPWDEKRVTEDQARHLMHGYYACVSYVDAQIGRLLDALEETGEADNTIVVLWSDHGWKLGEFNGWGKMSNYEIDTRVPLIISAPQMARAGESCEQPVELLDLFPTICELAGVPRPEFTDGESLLDVLEDRSAQLSGAAFSQYYRRHEDAEYMGYAIRTRTHRFVEWREFSTGKVTATELYDHTANHSESKNIAETAPDTVKELAQKLLKDHPRRPLQMVPAVHSNPNAGRWQADLAFHNQKDTAVTVYPITPLGRRGREIALKPGQKVRIKARIGGVFVVESRDGTVHQIHSPAVPFRVVEIK